MENSGRKRKKATFLADENYALINKYTFLHMRTIIASFVVLLIPMLIGCNSANSFDNCMEESVSELKEITGFDYYHFLREFENFLLEEALLNDVSPQSYASFIRDKRYCDIPYHKMIKEIDNHMATSPSIGGAYFDCFEQLTSNMPEVLNSDFFQNTEKNTISMLENIDEKQFERKNIKLLVVYVINDMIGTCDPPIEELPERNR